MGTTRVAEAAERATGHRPNRSTVSRWISHGVAGHRLAAKRCGGRWVIDPADLDQFLRSVDQAAASRQ